MSELEESVVLQKRREKQARIQAYLDDQKSRIEMLERTKSLVQDEQQSYFGRLAERVGAANITVSEHVLKRLETKVCKGLENGAIEFEPFEQSKHIEAPLLRAKVRNVEREKELLQQKLKGIDFELSSLQQQKIDNPFSAYSQPTLKVFTDEEDMIRKQQAVKFVKVLNQKEHELKQQMQKKRQEEAQQHQLKERELEDQMNQAKVEDRRAKHEKIRQHIVQLKDKHETRLQEMMNVEELYFKQLDRKLELLRQGRKHLKGKEVEKETMLTGVRKHVSPGNGRSRMGRSSSPAIRDKPQDNPQSKPSAVKTDQGVYKQIQVEKPLFKRVQRELEEKFQKELLAMKTEKQKMVEHRSKYSNIDLEAHLHQYKQKKQELKDKYERMRLEKLKRLGLDESKPQNPNRSFDSRLWIFSEQDKQQSIIDQQIKLEEQKETKRKVIKYVDSIKGLVHADDSKALEVQIQRDKLLNPQKYVRVVHRKSPGRPGLPKHFKESRDMDRELYFRDYVPMKPEQKRLLQYQTGNTYLAELPQLISKARQDQKKKVVDSSHSKILLDSSVTQVVRKDPLTKGREAIYQMKSVRQRYHLEQKLEDRQNWRKIANQKQLPNLLHSRSEYVQKLQQFEGSRTAKGRKNDRSASVSRNKLQSANNQTMVTEKIKVAASLLELRAQRLEQVANAQWNNQPLKAVEESEKISNIYIDSIMAKLKILELQQGSQGRLATQ